jgi:predicted permease
VDVGFDASRAVTVRLDPRHVGYSASRTAQFYDELERRLEALPGVEAAGSSFTIPMGYLFDSTMVVQEGQPVEGGDSERLVACNTVSPRFFDALALPLVAGRAFTEHDDGESRLVLIVNETMARQFWPGEDPIGKRLAVPRIAGGRLWEVVGVARDSKYVAVFEAPTPHFYMPIAQNFTYMRVLYVRTTQPPESMLTVVEREALALEPEIPVADLRTMAQAVEGGVGFLLFRIGAVQAGAMGILGLLLAVVGVYGVVSYGATQRVREIGIRVALGAQPQHVRYLVLRQGVGLVAAGIAVGIVAASGVTRLIAQFFVLVSATDVLTFTAVTTLLGLTALAACYFPARRATRVDPIVALRHE